MSDSGKTKLKQGVDWNGWAWQFPDGTFCILEGVFWDKPRGNHPSIKGKWVRVKFVEVKP